MKCFNSLYSLVYQQGKREPSSAGERSCVPIPSRGLGSRVSSAAVGQHAASLRYRPVRQHENTLAQSAFRKVCAKRGSYLLRSITKSFGFFRSFRSAKNPYLLLDIGRADLELQWILSSGGLTASWERVSYIRRFLQESLQTLLETDIKFCQAENVEQHFWKILFYNMIEILRKGMPKENSEGREHYKKIMMDIIDDGTVYLENLLTVLENTYKFKLDTFLASPALPKGLGFVGLALVSAQKIFLYLGDLARYKEQVNETTNYGKSRQ